MSIRSRSRAIAVSIFLAASVALFAAVGPATARTVETVAINPSIEPVVTPQSGQGFPGETVATDIEVANTGAELELGGTAHYLGSLFTTSTICSWYAALERRNADGTWSAVAGAAATATGYVPRSAPAVSTGLSFSALPVPMYGVTYPESGDRVIGTRIAGPMLAIWRIGAEASLSPAVITELLDQTATPQLRLRFHAEAERSGLFGSRYVNQQDQTASFGEMLRSLSPAATDVTVTVRVGGTVTRTFTPQTDSQLATIGPGQSVMLSAAVDLPGVSPRGTGESDGDYLARLRAALGGAVDVRANAEFTATGSAEAPGWWLFDITPPFTVGPDRRLSTTSNAATVARTLPIVEIAKTGPDQVEPGGSAAYAITVTNSGNAAAAGLNVTDRVGAESPAPVAGFGPLDPGQSQAGVHLAEIPTGLPGGDISDHAEVRWTDSAGNGYGPLGADFTSTVVADTTPPPAPVITVAPVSPTNQPSATFEFTGEPGGTFKCAVDAAEPAPCLAPHMTAELAEGEHVFAVFQVDDAGNAGPPASRTWRIDVTRPEPPALTGAPSGSTRQRDATVNFTGEPGGEFECSLDDDTANGGGAFNSCQSPVSLTDLVDGEHSVSVRQVDDAGNVGDPASVAWIVDNLPPDPPRLDATPASITTDQSAGFGFSGEPGGEFECSLDAAEFAVCANPVSYEQLAEGGHEFAVRQIDDAGNVGSTSMFDWRIDRTAPDAPVITSAPPPVTNQLGGSIEFSAAEPGGRLECSTDGAEFATCSSPSYLTGLDEGSHSFSVRQVDDAGNTGSVAGHAWVVDATAPAPPEIHASPSGQTTQSDAEFAFSGEPEARFECRLDDGGFEDCGSRKTYTGLAEGDHSFAVRQTDVAGNVSEAAEILWTIQLYDPPDELPETDYTPMAEQTDFLYAGANPIQTGVAEGTIEPTRASVLRGFVKTATGEPIPGVSVSVVDAPEFGQTITTEDGEYSMAVNGGGSLRVRYEKDGCLPVERRLDPDWLDYDVADDAVMTPLDTAVTTVDTSGVQFNSQVVVGTPVADADGVRRPTLVIPPNTGATIRLPDGSTQSTTELSLRQTEFTVGPGGEEAMPAPLPGTSAYTYAMAITADGVPADQASRIEFSRPVISYVNAVVDMPIGSDVPVGGLDYFSGTWSRQPNGRVLKILGRSGGVAQLDIDGSGTPATPDELAALGIGIDELLMLANNYADDMPIWRVPIQRAGGVDYNFMKNIDGSAGPTPDGGPEDPDCSETSSGSIIECESQGLGEHLPVAGTSYHLSYNSRRTAGRTAGNTVTFRVTGDTVPANLRRILVEVRVAGRKFEDELPPEPNQTYTFTWDGRDAFGRELVGTTPLDFGTGFVYPTKYRPVAEDPAFGRYPVGPAYRGVELVSGRAEAVIWRGTRRTVGTWRAKNSGLGGWSLDSLHRYDPISRTLMLGDGKQYKAENVNGVVTTIAGSCMGCPAGTLRTPATSTSALKGAARSLAVTDDGSVYIASRDSHYFDWPQRVSPTGALEDIRARGGPVASSPVEDMQVRVFEDLAAGPDGSVYFIGRNFSGTRARIGRIPRDGPMEWLQPLWGADRIADGVDIENLAPFGANEAVGLDVGIDGTIYIVTQPDGLVLGSQARVWRIAPTGEIDAVVGSGETGDSEDSGFARNLNLNLPSDVVVSDEGDLYVADRWNNRVLHVDPAGNAERVAWPRNEAQAWQRVRRLAMGKDGRLLMVLDNFHVWSLETDGSLVEVTPNIANEDGNVLENGDGGPFARAAYGWTRAADVGPDGSVFLGVGPQVRKISPPLPGFTNQELVVPSPDGVELYVFDRTGRHLRTLDAKTNAVTQAFAYDARGLIESITDGDGDVTTVERDGVGKPVAFHGPDGHTTSLLVDNAGDLRRLTEPSGREFRMDYDATGLLTAMSDPRGGVSEFTYDSRGRLVRDDDRGDGFKTLTRTDKTPAQLPTGTAGEFDVALATALGFTTTHTVTLKRTSTGPEHVRRVTQPDGTSSRLVSRNDGSSSFTFNDGTTVDSQQKGDPRWGTRAPYISSVTLRTPAGKQVSISRSRSVQMGPSASLLDMTRQTDTTTVNGKTSSETWEKASAFTIPQAGALSQPAAEAPAERETLTSPDAENLTFTYDGPLVTTQSLTGQVAGSTSLTYNDDLRIKEATTAGSTVSYTYDPDGLLTSVGDLTLLNDSASGLLAGLTLGNTATQITRDSYAEPSSVATNALGGERYRLNLSRDALGRITTKQEIRDGATTTWSYTYDAAGRLEHVGKDGSTYAAYTYDQNGNRTSTVKQGAPTYAGFDARDRMTTQGDLDLTYNQNGELTTKRNRTSGQETTLTYSTYGDLTGATTPDGRAISYLLDGAGRRFRRPRAGSGRFSSDMPRGRECSSMPRRWRW